MGVAYYITCLWKLNRANTFSGHAASLDVLYCNTKEDYPVAIYNSECSASLLESKSAYL